MTEPAAAPDRPGRRARRGVAGVVGLLAAANLARSYLVPGSWHLPWNLATGAGAVAVAWAAGLRTRDLGLAREHLRPGLRLGGLAFGGISAVVVVGGLLGMVSDDRTDLGAGAVALRVLVLIPVGTVVVEELAFRGALHGLLAKATGSTVQTLAAGAVLFGLWHVVPAARGGGVGGDELPVALVVAGTFAATTAAGFGFGWLRERSGSVVAPALAHLATNSVTFLVAWAAG